MGKREGNSGGSSFEHTRGDAVRTRGGLAGKVRDEGDDVAFSAEEFSRTRVGESGGEGGVRWVWSLGGALNDVISGQCVLTSLPCFHTFFSTTSRSIIILHRI